MAVRAWIAHEWTAREADGNRRLWVCDNCDLSVEAELASKPEKAAGRVVGLRYVGADVLQPSDRLPDCFRLRRVDHEPGIDPRARECLHLLEMLLGAKYVGERVGTVSTMTPEQELRVKQLYAALRVHSLEALHLIDDVGERLREARREQLDAQAVRTRSR